MKQCISRVIQFFTHLWRTLKEYVSRHVRITHKDLDGNGTKDWDVQILTGQDVNVENNKVKEDNTDDIKSN